MPSIFVTIETFGYVEMLDTLWNSIYVNNPYKKDICPHLSAESEIWKDRNEKCWEMLSFFR